MVKSRGFFLKIFVLVTTVIGLFTAISAWVGLFKPDQWWFLAILGLGFPMLFVLNLLLIPLWVLLDKKVALIPLFVFLISIVKLPAIIQFNDSDLTPDYVEDQSVEVKIISYNVRLFDLYNWSHNFKTRKAIFDFLGNSGAGIVCFQEFYSSAGGKMNNEKELPGVLNMRYMHAEYPITKFTSDNYGIATFSKFPIVKKGVIYLDKKSTNICIFSDIKIDDDTIRVYNCHLQSVRFGMEDYKFIEDISKSGEDTETIQRTRTIFGRLKRAFVKRAVQAEMIAASIRESPHPVIVCGDFNDTALSYSYKVISGALKDAFRQSGNGLGITYAGPIPGLRIDYILHSNNVLTYGFKTHKIKLSDHFPIEARFVIKP